jgi:hypothetical protein
MLRFILSVGYGHLEVDEMRNERERDFATELQEAKAKLKRAGRDVEVGDCSERDEYGGLKNDLDLPYSSLPKLTGRRWRKTEIYA